jgi:2',3'-cyclic-nucleotide 2'-phosphodiesterase / 3'-nucleotidase
MLSIKFRRATCLLVMLVTLLSLFSTAGMATPVAALETQNIVILGTSDLHGNVDNYDYFTDSVPTGTSQRGLTKIMTYVNGVRASNSNTILIDNGDTIQGNPLAYYFNMIDTSGENPLAAAMDYMGYAAATVGNHEFNYGPAVLNRFEAETDFPLLSANVTGCRDYTFQPYLIQEVGGVQVGILGLTPPAVPHWERPENIVDCVFGDAMAAANYYVPIMRAAGADVIVAAAHAGLDETYGYGRDENFVKYLANEVPGIDVILAGHAHTTIPAASQFINGVLVTEPNYHGRNISDIRITVEGGGDTWTVTTKSATAPALGITAEDAALKGLMQPYHDATVAYINTPIGEATGAFPGGFQARIADGPLADLINHVQTEAAAEAGFPVEASLAALFTNDAKLNAGPIKLKDAYAVYIYDNTLYVIDATGQQIKDELEWTAGYFNQYYYEPAGVTVNSGVRDYNYDLWSGIDYKLDVTKPVGQRVVELSLNGQPLAMDQVVRVALNNYRATGKFPTAPKLYQSTTEVRELITNWIMERGTISPSDVFVQNFTLLPPVNTWLSTTAAQPVTPSDYAGLLSTAFAGSQDDYLNFPGYTGPHGTTLNRQESFFVLSGAVDNLTDIAPDRSILKGYSDVNQLLGWAKDPTALLIQAGIFVPTNNELLPTQIVTNAEALAWVREVH